MALTMRAEVVEIPPSQEVLRPDVCEVVPAIEWETPGNRTEFLGEKNPEIQNVIKKLEALGGDQPKLKITPNLYRRKVELPADGRVENFFSSLFKLNPDLAFFYDRNTKTAIVYDPVLDGKKETVIPLGKTFAKGYLKVVEASVYASGHKDFLTYDPLRKGIVVRHPEQIASFATRLVDQLRRSELRQPMVFELKYAKAVTGSMQIDKKKLATSTPIKALGVMERLQRVFEFAGPGNEHLELPSIYAMERDNNIVIVDYPHRRQEYQDAIDQFDRPRELVEITAAIIDVQVDAAFEWDSQFEIVSHGSPGSMDRLVSGFRNTEGFVAPNKEDVNSTGLPPSTLASGVGLNSATMITGSNYRILSKVKALESDGKARVLSQPSVLTIDNNPARIYDKFSAYGTVAGSRQAKFYNFNAGLELNILPRIVTKKISDKDLDPRQPRRLHLLVGIGDGDVKIPTGDNALPTGESTNRIVTQVVLRDGESLLIGGRYSKTQTDDSERVPFVGNIPVVGAAFKRESKLDGKFQRLYLITPRIVTPGEERAGRNAAAGVEMARRVEIEAAAEASEQARSLEERVYTLGAISGEIPEESGDEVRSEHLEERKARKTPVRDLLRRRRGRDSQ